MTIVLGVLSILAGIFVFSYCSILSVLSSMADSYSAKTTSGAFLIVAICLIVAGLCGCICKNGTKQGATICAAIFYFLGALFAFVFKTGDLQLWTVVCIVMFVVYLFMLYKTQSNKTFNTLEINDDGQSDLSEDTQKALKAKEKLYQKCVRAFNSASELDELITIRKAFELCEDYKDARAYISKCDTFINIRKTSDEQK